MLLIKCVFYSNYLSSDRCHCEVLLGYKFNGVVSLSQSCHSVWFAVFSSFRLQFVCFPTQTYTSRAHYWSKKLHKMSVWSSELFSHGSFRVAVMRWMKRSRKSFWLFVPLSFRICWFYHCPRRAGGKNRALAIPQMVCESRLVWLLITVQVDFDCQMDYQPSGSFIIYHDLYNSLFLYVSECASACM